MPSGPHYHQAAVEYAAACAVFEEAAAALTEALKQAIEVMPEPPTPYREVVARFAAVVTAKALRHQKRQVIEQTAVWDTNG